MEFDVEYVHCVYDEALVGEHCVFADDLLTLALERKQRDR